MHNDIIISRYVCTYNRLLEIFFWHRTIRLIKSVAKRRDDGNCIACVCDSGNNILLYCLSVIVLAHIIFSHKASVLSACAQFDDFCAICTVLWVSMYVFDLKKVDTSTSRQKNVLVNFEMVTLRW